MATLAFLGSAAPTSKPPHGFAAKARDVVLHRQFKVADIIAADATMTTNGYIAANDIIQLLPVTAGFVAESAILRIITAGTASVTFEVGLAGGAELLGSTPLAADGTAGTCYKTIEADSYDLGHVFTAADTIDIQFGTANVVVGEFELWVFGRQLVLGSAT